MTIAEAPFWVWVSLVLNSSLFLVMCLAPILWKRHQEEQAKTKLQPVPVKIKPNGPEFRS
ncbi:MAG: hypothetical protein KF753_11890 [Caldilineaceae bacterium]|nr:hypothetical protein [Caldilineaceae bacterium]